MIGEGVLKVDDYIRFGKFLDELEKWGAVNFIYTPKNRQLIAVFPRECFGNPYSTIFPKKEEKIKVNRNLVFVFFKV